MGHVSVFAEQYLMNALSAVIFVVTHVFDGSIGAAFLAVMMEQQLRD